MSADPVERLTDKEREALRLVPSHGSFREIAEALGVSESAVRDRLQNASKKLGVRGRHAAARLLLASERTVETREMTGVPNEQVAPPDNPTPNALHPVSPSVPADGGPASTDPHTVGPVRARLIRLLEGEGEGNELNVKQRIMRIGFWMIVGIILFCLLGAVLNELGQAGRRHRTAERTSF